MKIVRIATLLAFSISIPATMATAQDRQAKKFVVVNEDVGVPVFAYDITDRPYRIVGQVRAGVRKATLFSGEASQAKIYRELWEKAEKLGADAVINARYGESQISMFSWGRTNASGTAIRFLAPGEASR